MNISDSKVKNLLYLVLMIKKSNIQLTKAFQFFYDYKLEKIAFKEK